MRSVIVSGVVSVALLSNGCSFVLVKGTPARVAELPPSAPLECTSGKAAPVIDTLIGGYQVFRTTYALSANDAAYEGAVIQRDADIALGVGLTALFFSSALYGFSATSTCSKARALHLTRQQLAPPPPEAGPPPGAPGPAGQPAPEPAPSPATTAPPGSEAPPPASSASPPTGSPGTQPAPPPDNPPDTPF